VPHNRPLYDQEEELPETPAWGGAGSVGQYLEERQSSASDQTIAEYNPEYSYADNPPNPPNPYVQEQVNNAPVGVGDFLDGWHYRDPPEDLVTGEPLGPQGNRLPSRAIGWKPNGEPYYGEGIQSFFLRIKDKFESPVDKPDRILPITTDFGDIINTIPRAWDTFSGLGQEEGERAGLFKQAGRLLVETPIEAFMYAIGQTSEWTERYGTATSMTLRELGEDSPLPELIEYPDWLPSSVRGLGAITQLFNPMLWARAVTGPPKSWEKRDEIWDDNLEVSRMGYTAWTNEAIKGEFISRLKGGEDGDLLAMELEDPMSELLGQIIFDPLNILDLFGFAKFHNVKRGYRVADELIGVSDEITDLIKHGDDLTSAAGAEKIANLSKLVGVEVDNVAKNQDKLSKSHKLLNYTTEGKRFDVTRRVGSILGWVAVHARKSGVDEAENAENIANMWKAMTQIASSNDTERTEGLITVLNHFPHVPQPFLSRGGMETGIVMRKIVEDDNGIVDFVKFNDKIKAIKREYTDIEEQKQNLIKFFDKRQKKAIDDIFPTVLEKMEKGEEVSPVVRFMTRFDKKANKIYGPLNQFFANVYMGLNPGYAMRNMWTNTVHVFVDMGPRAFYGAGSFFKPQAWVDKTIAWLGRAPAGMIESFGPKVLGTGGVKQEGKWYQLALRWSEDMEMKAAYRVVGKSVDDTMRALLKPGRLFDQKDLNNLSAAGATKNMTASLWRMIIEHKGDVPKARAAFLNLHGGDKLETRRVLDSFLNEKDIDLLHQHGHYEQFIELVNWDDKEAALEELRSWPKKWAQKGDEIANEGTPFTDLNNNSELSATALTATDAGDMSPENYELFQMASQANSDTFDAYDAAKTQKTTSV